MTMTLPPGVVIRVAAWPSHNTSTFAACARTGSAASVRVSAPASFRKSRRSMAHLLASLPFILPTLLVAHPGDEGATEEARVHVSDDLHELAGDAVERPDLGGPAGAGGRDDLVAAVPVHVGHGNPNAPGEADLVREELGDHRAVHPAEDAHVRAAAGAGPGDDVGDPVPVHVAGRDEDAAGEGGRVGEEAVHEAGKTHARERVARAVEDANVGPAAGPGAGDDLGVPVPVEVGRRHPDTAGEAD